MTTADASLPALELRGIHKRFGDVVANAAVDLAVRAGSVHAVVGENGAGKSTLMRIAYGHTRADAGTIAIKGAGVPRARHSPAEAIRRGVGMVHQHFMLVSPLSVVDNVVLGREPTAPWPRVDVGRAARELSALSERLGLDVDPHATVDQLSVGEQQRVEILKVLWRQCDVLILDEPTAVLSPPEVSQLLAMIRELAAGGATVVLITHKLDEVAQVADRITVMRAGRVVDELPGGAAPEAIARAMVGRPVLFEVARAPATPGDVVLAADAVRASRDDGAIAVDGVSLEVRAGEIVGVAGVEGNGQSQLVDVVTGLRAPIAGRVRVGGVDVTTTSVQRHHAAGLSCIPEDRLERGLIAEMTVADNLALGRLAETATRFGLDRAALRSRAEQLIAELDVRPPDPDALAGAMSGGNQQKLVVARELTRPRAVALVCAQPTRGVDIAAVELIHRRIVAARDAGLGVLLLSADLNEILSLSDRVIVLYRGRVAGELDAAALAAADAAARLGELMTGARAAAGKGGG